MYKKTLLNPLLFVTLVIIFAVSFLSITDKFTRAVLEARQDPETLILLQQIFIGANYYSYDDDTGIYTLYERGRGEIGYAFYGSDRGYRGVIDVLVGLQNNETIQGIVIIQQHEDYAYWDRLINNEFFEQFTGLKIENCFLTGYGAGKGQVDAASGATVSSWGVTDAVRKAALTKSISIK